MSLRALAALRVPVAESLLPALGVTASEVAAAQRDGRLVVEGGRARVNALVFSESADEEAARRALGTLLSASPDAGDDLWFERARLCLGFDEPVAADAFARAAVAAFAGGTLDRLAGLGTSASVWPRWIALERASALRVLVEGGHHREAVPLLLSPEERARGHLAEGRPAEALAALEGGVDTGPESALLRARAHLDRGEPQRARGALDGCEARADGIVDELAVLRVRVAGACGEGFREAIEALRSRAQSSGRRRLALYAHQAELGQAIRDGDARLAEGHLAALVALAREVGAGRFVGAAAWYDGVLGFLEGSHARMAAALRDPRPFGAGSHAFWRRLEVGEKLVRGRFREVILDAEALERDGIFGASSYAANAWVALGEPERALARLEPGGEAPRAQAEEAVLLARIARRWLGATGAARGPRDAAPPATSATVVVGSAVLDAECALDAGDLDRAAALAEQALVEIERTHLFGQASSAWLVLADVAARRGGIEDALARLARALDRAPHPEGPEARFARAARARVLAEPVPDDQIEAWVAAGDARAVLLARPEHAAFSDVGASVRACVDAAFRPPRAFVIAADGAWFQDGAEPVRLERRQAVRRILAHLADRRILTPGAVSTVDDLVAHGWPGERILAEAALDRVYQAVATLRRLGLKQRLQSVDGGYRLDPSVPLVRA